MTILHKYMKIELNLKSSFNEIWMKKVLHSKYIVILNFKKMYIKIDPTVYKFIQKKQEIIFIYLL